MGLQSVLQCVTHVAKLDHPVKREGAAPSSLRAQELCESRRGRPGLPSLISLVVSVDVKQHSTSLHRQCDVLVCVVCQRGVRGNDIARSSPTM